MTGDARSRRLPPGQRPVTGFPRFGVPGPPPAVPDVATVEVVGAVREPFELTAHLGDLPRRTVRADFHCVSGWSATDLAWEGVAVADVVDRVLGPRVAPGAQVSHLVFEGLDGYRSVVRLEDAVDPDVLLADRLDGEPLGSDHGAPLRLVSPQQYGFISTKHLCRISVCTSEPHERYHPTLAVHLGLTLVKPHERARVWREERHRYLPGRVVRPVYHRLIRLFRTLNQRRG